MTFSNISPGTRKFVQAQIELGPTFSASSQTGPETPGDVQTPLNQVAVSRKLDTLTKEIGISKGLAGPLTGLDVNAEAEMGGANQTFALLDSTAASVRNITSSVESLQSARLANTPSARFFQDTLTRSFYPGASTSGKNRTAEEILATTSGGSISDLSTMMAVANDGVTTSKQLIEGINEGLIGYSTVSSKLEANRLGPQGLSRERQLK